MIERERECECECPSSVLQQCTCAVIGFSARVKVDPFAATACVNLIPSALVPVTAPRYHTKINFSRTLHCLDASLIP